VQKNETRVDIGYIEALFRYPVKSMRGEVLTAANLGWHGIGGDRRLALRRLDDRSVFPWLTAGKHPDLVLYTPLSREERPGEEPPTHVRTPAGEELTVFGGELAEDISRRCGMHVQMMQLKHGIFDDATISLITSTTAAEVTRLAGVCADVRRFRPNIVVRSTREAPFEEDQWVGGQLTFGDEDDAPAVSITMRDVRCAMVNIDPDTGSLATEVLKAAVRANNNNAGVYGTVTRVGTLVAGQSVKLRR
jgi:uncharacterized protein